MSQIKARLFGGLELSGSDGVELVLTREPLGGKPDGVDAGPVVAQGAFGAV